MFDTTVIEAHELAKPVPHTWAWGRVIWGGDDIRWRCARVNDMVLEEENYEHPNHNHAAL